MQSEVDIKADYYLVRNGNFVNAIVKVPADRNENATVYVSHNNDVDESLYNIVDRIAPQRGLTKITFSDETTSITDFTDAQLKEGDSYAKIENINAKALESATLKAIMPATPLALKPKAVSPYPKYVLQNIEGVEYLLEETEKDKFVAYRQKEGDPTFPLSMLSAEQQLIGQKINSELVAKASEIAAVDTSASISAHIDQKTLFNNAGNQALLNFKKELELGSATAAATRATPVHQIPEEREYLEKQNLAKHFVLEHPNYSVDAVLGMIESTDIKTAEELENLVFGEDEAKEMREKRQYRQNIISEFQNKYQGFGYKSLEASMIAAEADGEVIRNTHDLKNVIKNELGAYTKNYKRQMARLEEKVNKAVETGDTLFLEKASTLKANLKADKAKIDDLLSALERKTSTAAVYEDGRRPSYSQSITNPYATSMLKDPYGLSATWDTPNYLNSSERDTGDRLPKVLITPPHGFIEYYNPTATSSTSSSAGSVNLWHQYAYKAPSGKTLSSSSSTLTNVSPYQTPAWSVSPTSSVSSRNSVSSISSGESPFNSVTLRPKKPTSHNSSRATQNFWKQIDRTSSDEESVKSGAGRRLSSASTTSLSSVSSTGSVERPITGLAEHNRRKEVYRAANPPFNAEDEIKRLNQEIIRNWVGNAETQTGHYK